MINWGILQERLDAEYYRPSHLRDLESLNRSQFPLYRLEDISSRVVDGPFGSTIKAEDYVEVGIPFIRVADVTHGEGTIKANNLIFISHEAHENIIRSKVVPGDVVVAKTGATMGAASVIPPSIQEANIRGDLGAITTLANVCLPEYLSIYINSDLGQRLFWRLDSGGTRGRVVIGNLRKYPVLIPPIEVQEDIVARMDAAYAAKRAKEAEAQRLLDSIDPYLLGELGIELPEEGENTVEERVFYRPLSEVTGGRFDPNYHKKIELIIEQDTLYDFVSLGSLLKRPPQYGANEAAVNGDKSRDVRYIRITDLNEIGELTDNAWKTAQIIEDRYLLEFNDLLFARSGSVGRAYLHKGLGTKAIFAGYLIRFVVDETIGYPDYIFYFCHSCIYKLWVDAIHRPAVQANINAEEYKSLPIALPPLDKQIEIANKISTIRSQAKQLEQEAVNELTQAKQAVEAMILGESSP